ncbi:MAG: ubiquitin carboxyl-terminal hydrolase [Clostridia bacterium]|nr:ubiquitin carboxyl-terminal hydrolase [Clostridia bacterium]
MKLHLRICSCLLGMLTFFTAVPTHALNVALPNAHKQPQNGLSTGAKVALSVVTPTILVGAGVLIYALSGGSSGDGADESLQDVVEDSTIDTDATKTDSPTVPKTRKNANLTNTNNLCFWHSFLQQMYSLEKFRQFINDVAYFQGMKSAAEKAKNEIGELEKSFAEKSKKTTPPSDKPNAATTCTTTSSGSGAGETGVEGVRASAVRIAQSLSDYLPDGAMNVVTAAADDVAAVKKTKEMADELLKACEQIEQIRGIFAKMAKGGRVSKETCKKFAQEVFKGLKTSRSKPVFGQQHDISEVWTSYISSVNDVYKRYCKKNGKHRWSNILDIPLQLTSSYRPSNITLSNLLTADEPSMPQKCAALNGILSSPAPIDPSIRRAARNVPIGSFLDKDDAGNMVIPHEDLEVLFGCRKGTITGHTANVVVNELSNVPAFDAALRQVPLEPIEISVSQHQFTVFIARFKPDRTKDTRRIDFGNEGTVVYKNKTYELTAISVHSGSTLGSGHYYTYKEQNGQWLKYDDCSRKVSVVSWPSVKKDAETNCAMLTFTEKQIKS